jgi:ubiquinone/menaquinone biosynthesis C-methylase UbiE
MTRNKNKLFDIDFVLNKLKIKESEKVADLGCGKFEYFIKPIAKKVGSKGIVYGVDILQDTVENIKKLAWEHNLKQVKAIWSDLEVYKGTKINSYSLDKALIINVLNQSQNKAEILKEAVRLLKTNGLILIIDWQLTASPLGPEPNRRVNPEAIKDAAPKLGLQLMEEFTPGPYHFALIFNKL